jgi:hypothetical protein
MNETADDRGHRFSNVSYLNGRYNVQYCSLCGYYKAQDGDGSRFPVDSDGQPIQRRSSISSREVQCPHPVKRLVAFSVANDSDLDKFSAEMTRTLIASNAAMWPMVKAPFERLVRMSRLCLQVKPEATTYYIVETDIEIIWEEDERWKDGTRIIAMRVPSAAGMMTFSAHS